MIETRPIIVTATLPPDLFALADQIRKAHFPPERNVLSAHLTLFHAIPPSCGAELRNLLADLGKWTSPARARLTGIVSLGGGTALGIESPDLMDLRGRIAKRFKGSLTAQDNHRPRFHITIQNKVTARKARELQAELAPTIGPRDFAIPGLEMHFYDGGPWELAGKWSLRGRGEHR